MLKFHVTSRYHQITQHLDTVIFLFIIVVGLCKTHIHMKTCSNDIMSIIRLCDLKKKV